MEQNVPAVARRRDRFLRAMHKSLRIAEDRMNQALDPRRYSAELADGDDDDVLRKRAQVAIDHYFGAYYAAESFLDPTARELAEMCRQFLGAMLSETKGWSRHGVVDTAEARQMATQKRLARLHELAPKLSEARAALLKRLIATGGLAR